MSKNVEAAVALALVWLIAACGSCTPPLSPLDGGDDSLEDGGSSGDGGPKDAGTDAGGGLPDAGLLDAGVWDGGADAGTSDGGVRDGGATDAGADDAGRSDAGVPDAGFDAGSGGPDGGGLDAGIGCPSVTLAKIRGPYGGRVAWHPDGGLLALDIKTLFGNCYDVYTLRPDGSGLTCLTCTRTDVPPNNKGQPSWHPSGRYLLFQAEKDRDGGFACGPATNPGSGVFNDVWVLDLAQDRAYPLVTVPLSSESGVLHPHFSPDGKRVLWSQMYGGVSSTPGQEAGRWRLMLADIVTRDGGMLEAVGTRQLVPWSADAGEGMAESHGFTPDGLRAVYSGSIGLGDYIWDHNGLWTISVDGGTPDLLTATGYNEHAHFSPSGRKVAFMSTRWTSSMNFSEGTEFYLMNADGGSVCQLTWFNTVGYPGAPAGKTTAADLDWSPDGRRIVAYAFSPGLPPVENVWVLDFSEAQ